MHVAATPARKSQIRPKKSPEDQFMVYRISRTASTFKSLKWAAIGVSDLAIISEKEKTVAMCQDHLVPRVVTQSFSLP